MKPSSVTGKRERSKREQQKRNVNDDMSWLHHTFSFNSLSLEENRTDRGPTQADGGHLHSGLAQGAAREKIRP